MFLSKNNKTKQLHNCANSSKSVLYTFHDDFYWKCKWNRKETKSEKERESAIEKANIEKQQSISKISEFNCFEPGFVSVIM